MVKCTERDVLHYTGISYLWLVLVHPPSLPEVVELMSSSDSCERTSITMLSSSSSSTVWSGSRRGDFGEDDRWTLVFGPTKREGGGEVLVPTDEVVGVLFGEDFGERLAGVM